MNIISELNDFINQIKKAKEITRALAVKMILEGKSYQEVKELLKVSHSFISLWKNQALFSGVESLKLQFKGTKSQLKPEEKNQVINGLREQEYLRLSDLKNYDECHLLWGDILGYVWGRTDHRIEIPIKNEKSRQTYYGALDYKTKEFIVEEYEKGNTENTLKFLKYLLSKRKGKRLAIFGDGAPYHDSKEFREYLTIINQDLSEEEWLITCHKFAPNTPEQNPVEDILLQVKKFLRQFYHLCKSFKTVKWLFKFFADGQIFNFPKLSQYGILPQPI